MDPTKPNKSPSSKFCSLFLRKPGGATKEMKRFSRRGSRYNARILESAKDGDEASLCCLLSEEHKKPPLSRTLQQALSYAIDAHSAPCVQLLLEAGANPNCIKSTGARVAIPVYAIRQDLVDILRVLLENGCNVNEKWIDSDTALHVAVRLRKKEATRMLMQAGALPTIMNYKRETALILAAHDDALDILDLLLAHPQAMGRLDDKGRTLLHTAVRYGEPKAVQHLMEKGFSADVQGQDGRTPLMDAVVRDDIEVVHILSSKCNVDYVGWRGMTASLIAAQSNTKGCLQALLEAGANVNVQDDMGYTALIHAGPVESMVTLLLQYGIDCNIQNHFGMTALWFAAFYQYTSVVSLLLRSNSNPELKGLVEDEFHTSPLEIALKRGHYDISRRIIYCGCNNRNLARFMANADIMPVFKNSSAGQALKGWIRAWLREVKSLKYLARFSIRQRIGNIRVVDKVSKLPLPKLLIQYVDLSEVGII